MAYTEEMLRLREITDHGAALEKWTVAHAETIRQVWAVFEELEEISDRVNGIGTIYAPMISISSMQTILMTMLFKMPKQDAKRVINQFTDGFAQVEKYHRKDQETKS